MNIPGPLLTAMVTPFDGEGEVNYAQAKRLARALIESGNDGLIITGTTGESPTLSKEEKLRLYAEVKEALAGQGAVVAGAGTYNTAESVKLTQEATKLGVDGILAVVPYYNNPSQEGLYQHFRAIAEATSLPVIVYNVPSRTVVSLAAETVIRLSEVPNIVGIKEASGNLKQVAQIVDGARPDFKVWSGNDADLLPILALGGYGVISVAGHLVGRQIKSLIEAWNAGDTQTAAALHRRLMPLFSVLFVVSNPCPVKHALNHVGFAVGNPRLPLVPPDPKSAAQIEAVLQSYQLDIPLPERAAS